jgi:hypothetical protein
MTHPPGWRCCSSGLSATAICMTGGRTPVVTFNVRVLPTAAVLGESSRDSLSCKAPELDVCSCR